MTRRTTGRGLARLVADTGTPLPDHTTPSTGGPSRRPFGSYVSPRGHRRRGAGRAATGTPPVAVWRTTSDQTPAWWPFITTQPLPPTGAQIGIDLGAGGGFCCDPLGWVTHDGVNVTNPNVFVFGKPGRGKSATVKAFCLRMMAYGYGTLILGDPKDEYEPLCRALNVDPFVLGPGHPARVNPLDLGPLGDGWTRLDAAEATRRAQLVFTRWLGLIRGLVGSQTIGTTPVPFGPSEETVVSAALRTLTGYEAGASQLRQVTIPDLWHLLDTPTADLIASCRHPSARAFLDATRTLRDALGALISGHLAGLFDAPTTITPDWDAPIQSLSLSRLDAAGDAAVGIALLCLNSWGHGIRETSRTADHRIVVRDETWKQMRLGLEPVKTLDANLRLSRADGDIQLVVFHKPSDPLSAGAAGSQATTIARDLLHLADTRILHGQDKTVADELADLLGLSTITTDLITGWAMAGKGRAVWTVGDRAYQVQTVLTPAEAELTYTNTAVT